MLRRLELNQMRRCVIPAKFRHLSTQNHLEGLNGPQLQAVRFPPHSSLQILAGPGTGKTRVLTSRVAELVLGHSHSPSSICAVTFTRKASREMKERLHGYLGAGPTEELKLGTFHSVCASYLRTYGPMVHVGPNFLIWDEEECSLLIKYIAESIHKGFAKNLPTAEVYEMFSIAKEQAKVNPKKGIETIIREALEHMMKGEYMSSTQDNPLYELELVLQLYSSYSRVLRESNALDFTDLLIKGLDLFRAIPWAREVSRLKHVLVDEFQDTSSLQYLLVKQLFKTTEGSISVVGDPDQSIYGWRGADSTVFKKMKKDLPQTKVIYLEENYRTTASNIAAAISIISQDKTRPPKTLFTSLTPNGPKPLKKGFPTTTEEEAFISQEINRLIVKSDGIINYGDCAILFRGNYSAGYFAKTLRNAGIPNRQLPELSLNDKFEVKTLLAFLRLAINNAHTPMLIRAMEGPLRVPGKVIANLIGRSVKQNITLFNALERLQSGLDHDTTPSSIEPATLLIQMLRHLKNLRQEGASPVDLIQYTIEATGYYQYLKEEFMDDLWRTKNVELTIKYARNYRASKGSDMCPVIAFLGFMRDLSRINNLNTGKVSLLTCHSAKGLEWPVIFVPDVIDGVYPHLKSNDVDEERRLFYVACTRAKCLVYLTYSDKRLIDRGGDQMELQHYESEFTKNLPQTLYQDKPPRLDKSVLDLFRRLLGRDSKAEGKNSQ